MSSKFYLVGTIKKEPRTEWRFYVGERGSPDLPPVTKLAKQQADVRERYEKFTNNDLLWDGTKSTQQFVVLKWQSYYGAYKVMHYFKTKDAAIIWSRGTLHKHHNWDGFLEPVFVDELPDNYLASVKTIPGIVASLVDDIDKALRSDNVKYVTDAMGLATEAMVQASAATAVLEGKERQLREKFNKWMK